MATELVSFVPAGDIAATSGAASQIAVAVGHQQCQRDFLGQLYRAFVSAA
jgi:hypothetical protein